MSGNSGFEIGETAMIVTGHAEHEDCQIVSANDDGTYQVRYKLWGQGEWIEGRAFPGLRTMGGLHRLKAEYRWPTAPPP